MYLDLQEVYWWGGFKRNIAKFMAKCPNCIQVKAEHQILGGLTQVMDVKWEDINIDFVVYLPQTHRQNDSIWVIVDILMKFGHFIPVRYTYMQRSMLVSTLMRLCICMESLCPSSRIEVPNSFLIFRGLFKRG